VVAHSSSAQTGPGALPGSTCRPATRRAPIAGLYGLVACRLPRRRRPAGDGQIKPVRRLSVTAAELASQYNVRPDTTLTNTAGIQAAIDAVKSGCSPSASYTKLSLLSLPAGTLNVTHEIHVDAELPRHPGHGRGHGGTRLVYRPDANTRYDTLTADGSDWDGTA